MRLHYAIAERKDRLQKTVAAQLDSDLFERMRKACAVTHLLSVEIMCIGLFRVCPERENSGGIFKRASDSERGSRLK